MNTKIIFSIIFFTHVLFCCSPAPGYVAATLKEQIDFAGVILIGTVTSISNGFNATAQLENVKYFRGCYGNAISVEGFNHSASCGAGIPSVGQKIIVFACGETGSLKLNQYIIHTGWVEHNFMNEM